MLHAVHDCRPNSTPLSGDLDPDSLPYFEPCSSLSIISLYTNNAIRRVNAQALSPWPSCERLVLEKGYETFLFRAPAMLSAALRNKPPELSNTCALEPASVYFPILQEIGGFGDNSLSDRAFSEVCLVGLGGVPVWMPNSRKKSRSRALLDTETLSTIRICLVVRENTALNASPSGGAGAQFQSLTNLKIVTIVQPQ